MFNLLLKKEFKEVFTLKYKKNKQSLFNFLFSCVLGLSLLALLLYLFILLEKRFSYYQVGLPLFTISLFLILIFQMLFHLPKFSKMVFNASDKKIIAPLPVSKKTITLAKVVVFYVEEFLSLALITVPLTVAFIITANYSSVSYLILIPILFILPLIVLGLSLLLSYPWFQLSEILKKKFFIQFLLIILVIGGISFLYQEFLNIFIGLVKEDRLAFIFNTDNALILENLAKYLIPVSFITGLLNGNYLNLLYLGLITAFFLLLTYFLSSFLYGLKIKEYAKEVKVKKNKVTSPTKALIKKEWIITFRNSNYLMSYGSLLVLLPIFLVVIISSLEPLLIRLIGKNFFIPFVILFVTMFVSIINSFGGLFISREKQNISILKMLPVSYHKQMKIKTSIAIFNGSLSLFVSMLVLFINKTLTLIDSLFIFLIGFSLIILLISLMAKDDLNKPSFKNEDNNLTTALVFSIVLPLLLFIFSLGLLFFMPTLRMYLVLVLGLFLITFLGYNSYSRSINKNFRKLRI